MRIIDADELRPDVRLKDGTLCFSKSRIANAPTIEPTTVYEFKGCDNCELDRPKGKWIEYEDDGLYAGECSCCKWKAVLYESDVLNMNFCPNCGARMEREEDDTEQTEG